MGERIYGEGGDDNPRLYCMFAIPRTIPQTDRLRMLSDIFICY